MKRYGCKPYKFGLDDIRGRQYGLINPYSYARRAGGSLDLILRFGRLSTLEGHTGCVNTVSFNPSGDLLISGSDDRNVVVWDWRQETESLCYASGHVDNVFQARAMPYSNDRIIVTCAADGQVRLGTVLSDGGVETKNLSTHEGRAHKLAIEPGSAHTFYSCGEDGAVHRFDLRDQGTSSVLFHCKSRRRFMKLVHLNCIFINPRRPEQFAVGGDDEFARVYDVRRLPQDPTGVVFPIDNFAPQHLIRSDDSYTITAVSYSHQGELLVSYNDELIYLFQQYHGLGSKPTLPTTAKKAKVSRDTTTTAQDDAAADNEPDGSKPQSYAGHRNLETVKGVSFFGPNTEYVASGSDCGHVYIWKKKGGQVVGFFKGDNSVVNCVEPHPTETVLATSGIDESIKLWGPSREEPLELPELRPRAVEVMDRNKARGGGANWNHVEIPAEIIIQLIGMQRRRHTRTRQAQAAQEKLADDDASDDDIPDRCRSQ